MLIQTRHTLYVCEIRFRKHIQKKVIEEVQEKIKRLRISENISVRPVLIYAGELAKGLVNEGYFDKCIRFSDLLTTQ